MCNSQARRQSLAARHSFRNSSGSLAIFTANSPRLIARGEIGHEDAASGYRLCDRNGFRLSSFRSSMPEWPWQSGHFICASYDE
jgi:hypothetical protein